MQDSAVGTEIDPSSLTEDSSSSMIPMSVIRLLLHATTSTQMVNIAEIGIHTKASTFVQEMASLSNKAILNTQLDPGIDTVMHRKQTAIMTDTGILIRNACHVPHENSLLTIINGEENENITLSSVYQSGSSLPAKMG